MAAVSLIIVCIVSFLTLKRSSRIENMIPSLDDIVNVDEDGTIHMDQRLNAIVTGIGQTMMQSFKMSALQSLSVNTKLDKGLKRAIGKDIIEEKMPLLNAGAGIFKEFTGYNVKKYITDNPDALMQLIGMAQKAGINIGGLIGNNNGAGSPSNNPGRM